MHPTEVAEKLRVQIHQFSGIISPHFSQPKIRFIEQRLLGIAASQDCKLSRIARALGEPIALKKTEERLSRHLATPQWGQQVQAQIVAQAARRIGEETLIVIDPTDRRKPDAQAMPYLATVRDGSTGQLARGYWCGVALACEPDSRKVRPLLQQLWSANAPDFVSENTPLLRVIDTNASAAAKRGLYVLDRGGDRSKLYIPLLARGLRFIVRLVGNRHLWVRGRLRSARDLARGVPLRYAQTGVREASGGEKKVHLQYGFRAGKLPGRVPTPLTLVVGQGFGQEPMRLLTNLEVQATRRSLWRVVRGSLARWLVEETLRFIKQS